MSNMTVTTCSRRLLTSQLWQTYQQNRLNTTDASLISSDKEHIKSLEDMPGPRTVPLMGGLIHHLPFGAFYKKTPPEIYDICRKKYGDIYKEKILHFSLVNIYDPEDFETVFRADGKYPVREAFMTLSHYNRKYNSNVQGVLTSQNKTWHELRSTFQQKMLRPKAVAAYFDEHAAIGDELIEKIELSKDDSGVIEDIRGDLNRFAIDCVALVCFNKRFDLLLSKENNQEATDFFNAVAVVMETSHNEFKRLPIYKLFETPSYKKFVKAQTLIKQIAIKYSKEALKKLEKNNGRIVDGEQGDLIPYLISKTSLTEEKVLSVISEIISAGVDTTSHHITYILYLLGKHPEIQQTLYEEIQKCLPDNMPQKETDISQMPYLKAVDKEVHRLLPVAMGTVRTLTQDIELKGYHIPAGTTIAIHWMSSMVDEKNFKDAKVFKPERWLRDQDERRNINPFASTPFGVGQRSCLGRRFADQETFIAIVKILKKYQVVYAGNDLIFDYGVSIAPANKMRFQFIPRCNY